MAPPPDGSIVTLDYFSLSVDVISQDAGRVGLPGEWRFTCLCVLSALSRVGSLRSRTREKHTRARATRRDDDDEDDDDDCDDEDCDDDGAAEGRTCGMWKNAREDDEDDDDGASGANEG